MGETLENVEMTLILTALCKKGICVCADKRYRIKDSDGLIKHTDNNNKIYKFNRTSLIIFNHGINKIGNKYWDEYCSDYENSNRWNNNSFAMIVGDFKNFIENDIRDQLKNEKLLSKEKRKIGFVLCGKTFYDSKFKIKELFWSFEQKKLNFKFKSHVGFVRTGEGKKCLENYINNNKELDSVDYWKKMTTDQAKDELRRLFLIAVEEKKQLAIKEFSDDYDIECIAK